MADILNLALPYFGLIFIGFACGKTRGLPESGLAWMNFFLLYVSLPALLFGIMSETPFSEIAKTTPCKVEMGPGSQALGPFASALADALPGRRQPLAHREPPQRAERA